MQPHLSQHNATPTSTDVDNAYAAIVANMNSGNVMELLESLRPTNAQPQPKVLRQREVDENRPGATIGAVGGGELGLGSGVTVDYMSPRGTVRQLSPTGASATRSGASEASKNGLVLASGKQKTAAVSDPSTEALAEPEVRESQKPQVQIPTTSDVTNSNSAVNCSSQSLPSESSQKASDGLADTVRLINSRGDLLPDALPDDPNANTGTDRSEASAKERDTFAVPQTAIPGSPRIPPSATPKPDYARERLVNLVVSEARQLPKSPEASEYNGVYSPIPGQNVTQVLAKMNAISGSPPPHNVLGNFPIIGANGTPKPSFLKRLDREDARGGELIRKRKQLTDLLKKAQMYIPYLDVNAYGQIRSQFIEAVQLLENSCVQSAQVLDPNDSGIDAAPESQPHPPVNNPDSAQVASAAVITNPEAPSKVSAQAAAVAAPVFNPRDISLENLNVLNPNIELNLGEFGFNPLHA